MKRRHFLQLSTLPFLYNCSGSETSQPAVNQPVTIQTPNTSDFTTTLPIPTLLSGTVTNGVRHFDLSIQAGTTSFMAGTTTNTYGINGPYLGPTVRIINGEEVSLNYTNGLSEITTMHGHGMHVPASMDGGPHQTIASGATWSARYTVNQPACTNWYHPHTHGKTGEQVYKGLAGLIIVDDATTAALDIPKEYGVDDIPLVIQDRRFDSNGQFIYLSSNMDIMQGMMGDVMLVNGAHKPYQTVKPQLVRLRILNGSNARIYTLQLSNGNTMQQIATDNGLLNAPVTLSSVTISPAERVELVVDFSQLAGKTVDLVDTNNSNTPLLRFAVTSDTPIPKTVPTTLANHTSLTIPSSVDRTFTLTMQGPGGPNGTPKFFINGQQMDMTRTDFTATLNKIEVWEIVNNSNMSHNFHTHATHFQIIERNGSNTNIKPYETGLKDTVLLNPNDRVKVVIQMTDYADATAPYMYHCHILEHEDRGMMGQFVVV